MSDSGDDILIEDGGADSGGGDDGWEDGDEEIPRTLGEAIELLKRVKRKQKNEQKALQKAEEDNKQLLMLCVKLNQKLNLVLETLKSNAPLLQETAEGNPNSLAAISARREVQEMVTRRATPSPTGPPIDPVDDDEEEPQALMCGYMNKKGRNIRNWKRRWFVLKGGVLFYYADKGQSAAKGQVPLDTCVIDGLKDREQTGRPCMALVVQGRTLYCHADTKKENMAWFLAINCMQQQLDYRKKMLAQNRTPDPRIISFFNKPMRSELDLHGRALPVEAAVALESSIRFHSAMRLLNIEDAEVGDIQLEPLSRAFGRNKFLTTIRLERNHVTADGAGHLADALKRNETITELYLSHNNLGDEGAIHLASALPEHPALVVLTLAHNGIGDAGAAALAEHIGASHEFPDVVLSGNEIGNDGAVALANMVGANPTILTCDLRSNQIGNVGVVAFADACGNSDVSIEHILLSDNNYDDDVKLPLARMLVRNHSLVAVNVAPIVLNAEALSALRLLYDSSFLSSSAYSE